MFDHPLIQIHAFEDIPLDQDLKLLDEKWMAEFEALMVKSVNGSSETAYSIGYYSPVAARAIGPDSMELSWYPNTYTRIHQVRITLPRSVFITCVGSWQYDYDPVIFVRGNWLTNLYLRSHSVFGLIDAIGVKKALASGTLTRPKLIELRKRIDEIAASNPAVAFLSFADSLLLKSNYTVGEHDSDIKYTYNPEKFIRLLSDIQAAYQSVLGLEIYAVITQGTNEYYDDGLLHISDTCNHISFNSLGLPFAQILAIDHCVSASIKSGIHPASDVYLDESLYHSLLFATLPNIENPRFPYVAPMATGPSHYVPVSFQLLADSLKPME